jgi:hypothetical protein
VSFANVPGLAVDGRYLYALRVRSSRSYCPYFEDEGSRDQRLLGVQLRIQLLY